MWSELPSKNVWNPWELAILIGTCTYKISNENVFLEYEILSKQLWSLSKLSFFKTLMTLIKIDRKILSSKTSRRHNELLLRADVSTLSIWIQCFENQSYVNILEDQSEIQTSHFRFLSFRLEGKFSHGSRH